jgi:drug/metabolite transporter (DMT)-like permease
MRLDRSSLIGIALVNVATLTWATNAVIGRHVRHDIGPLTLTAGRFLVGAALFWVLFRVVDQEEPPVKEDRWLLLGMALSGIVGFSSTYYLGLRFTTAVNATLINGLGPIAAALVGMVLFRYRTALRQIVVALGGVGVLVLGQGAGLSGDMSGDLIVLGAIFLWGFYSVFGGRVMVRRSAVSATAHSIYLGLPFLICAAGAEVFVTPIRPSLDLLWAVLYVGVFPTVVGYAAWNAGVKRLGPVGAMVFINTLPLYGALLGFLLLGEPLGWGHLAGGGLIVAGALFAAGARRPARLDDKRG